jgi:hypothetical protein
MQEMTGFDKEEPIAPPDRGTVDLPGFQKPLGFTAEENDVDPAFRQVHKLSETWDKIQAKKNK